MSNTKRLLELAVKGLEVERARVNQEIAEIESQIRQFGGRIPRTGSSQGASASEKASAKKDGNVKPAHKKRRLSAAGRKKLSDAAKRRWAASKKAGKSTL